MTGQPIASVIIPSRDRAASLARTIAALRRQESAAPWELIVVDDGSAPPLTGDLLRDIPDARLLRLDGRGPARARNAAIAEATGRYLLFTDDDTEPHAGWISAAVDHLEAHPAEAGVEGRVESPPFDPLRALSLESSGPGAYWTCNMAYRRDALRELGGFDEAFPFPHCEDLDLAFRALRRAPIGYCDEMAITHHPRPMSFRALAGRGRLTVSEVRLFERHRARYGRARHLPAPLFPVVQSVGFWRYCLRAAGRDPRRIARALGLGALFSFEVVRATVVPHLAGSLPPAAPS